MMMMTTRRGSIRGFSNHKKIRTSYHSFCAFLVGQLLLFSSRCLAQQQCTEQCDGGGCTQRDNFTQCQVVCNNTGLSTGVTVGTCQSSTFQNGSTVECIDGACRNSEFIDSSVDCTGDGNSCGSSTFNRTTVACLNDSCNGGLFYSSAVTCDLLSISCVDYLFIECSCCDGGNCPTDYPSCTADPVEFCKTLHLGRTCKEWGNPVCAGLNIEATGIDVTICDKGNCQNAVFSDAFVSCDNIGALSTCQQSSFSGGEVTCDFGACQSSQFTDTTVNCFDSDGEGSCNNAVFNRTFADCTDTSCNNVDFHASAVTCPGDNSCLDSWFSSCTCCDGVCPADFPSCTTDPVGFCKTLELGRTCKEWGNPVCESVEVTPTGQEVTICTQGDCVQAKFNGAAVLCYNKYNLAAVETCNAIDAQDSDVSCEAGACQKSTFSNSTVYCGDSGGDTSCASSSFLQSTVSCRETSCGSGVFTASAVTCADVGTCTGSSFDACSCCDGGGCSGSSLAPSCTANLADFCAKCASKGNPICGVTGQGASMPSSSSPPSKGLYVLLLLVLVGVPFIS